MKRNRSKFIVYFEPWAPGRHTSVSSKRQMKKLLLKANPGSEGIRLRLQHLRDGSISFWNMCKRTPTWIVPERDELLVWLESGSDEKN